VGFLDLVVQITLQRMILREGVAQKRWGEQGGRVMIECFDGLYEDAWAQARKVLSPQQVTDLAALIEHWREKHPDQENVVGVRFEDFAEARRQTTTLAKTGGGGGLSFISTFGGLSPLSPVDQATGEIRRTREAVDRIMFLSQRMPTMLRWQAEALASDVVREPEVQRTLAATTQASEAVTRVAKTVDGMPAALEQAQKPTAAILADWRTTLERNEKFLAEFQKSVKSVDELGSKTQAAMAETDKTFKTIGQVFDRLSTPTTRPTTTEVDKYAAAFDRLGVAAKEVAATVGGIKQTLAGPEIRSGLGEVEGVAGRGIDRAGVMGRGLVDHIAWRVVQVGAVLCLMVGGTAVVVRRVGGRKDIKTSRHKT
jgi:hypothetical protein